MLYLIDRKCIIIFLIGIFNTWLLFSQKLVLSEYSWDGLPGKFNCAAFSNNGKYLAGGGADGSIRIWDIEQGTQVKTLTHNVQEINRLQFSTDDSKIYSLESANPNLNVYDINTQKILKEYDNQNVNIKAFAYSDNGRYLAYCDAKDIITLYDLSESKIIRKYTGHWLLTSIKFSPDGINFATAGMYSDIKYWNINTDSCLFTIQTNSGVINSFVFSTDGRYILAAADSKDIKIYSTLDSQYSRSINTDNPNKYIGLTKDGNRIVSLDNNYKIIIYDYFSGQVISRIDNNNMKPAFFDISKDDKYIALANLEGKITIIDIQTGIILKTFEGSSGIITKMAVSADENMIAVAGSGPRIYIWNAQNGKLLNILEGHKDIINSFNFSNDGKYLVSGSDDRTIKTWDVQKGINLKTITVDIDVQSVLFTAEGQDLIFGNNAGNIIIMDLEGNPKKTFTLPGAISYVKMIAQSPDGSKISVTKNDGSLFLINTADGKTNSIPAFSTRTYPVIKFSKDGKMLTALSKDGTAFTTVIFFNSENLYQLPSIYSPAFQNLCDYEITGSADLVYLLQNSSSIINSYKTRVVSYTPIGNILTNNLYSNCIYLSKDNTKLFVAGQGYNNLRIISNLSEYDRPSQIQTSYWSLNFRATKGGELPPAQSIIITNAGIKKLRWYISSLPEWLEASPMSGEENDTIHFKVKSTSLNTMYLWSSISIINKDNPDNKSAVSINYTISPPYKISSNYPNPFANYTMINFSLPDNSKVELTIYNILGQKIKKVINNDYYAGSHTYFWSPDINLPAGVYFFELKTKFGTEKTKMLYLKNKLNYIKYFLPED
jgi:WD40 repeat protein